MDSPVEEAADHPSDDIADRGADEESDDTVGAEGIEVVTDLVADQRTEQHDDQAHTLDEDHADPAR